MYQKVYISECACAYPSVFQPFIGMEPSGALRLLAGTSCSDKKVGSIPNGQKRHFPILCYARKKRTLIGTDVCE